jgi:ribosome-associated protein
MRIALTDTIEIDDGELEWLPIRAQGAGGQHVNKVSSAVQLRVDLHRVSLPEPVRQRLLALRDQRVSRDGVLTIKAQRFRSLAQNRADALARFADLVLEASRTRRVRKATRPTRASQQRRVDEKTQRGRTKRLRRSLDD